MPGLTHTLDIAHRAMAAQQGVLSVIGHNIANVNTPGYSRQVAVLEAEIPSAWLETSFGGGVTLSTVVRKRDLMLDSELRRDLADQGYWQMRTDRLSTLEVVFNEPSDSGLGATLDAFWNAWSDLASDPDDMTRRAVVREQGNVLSDRFQTLGARFMREEHAIDQEITTRINEFNLILADLQSLNATIREAKMRGLDVNDLRDRRDLLLDEMSKLATIDYTEQEEGHVKVRLDTLMILDLAVYRPLDAVIEELPNGAGQVTVKFSNGAEADIGSGVLGGLIELREETLPSYKQAVDTLAGEIIDHVNTIHRASPLNTEFFRGRGMNDIAVSHDVESDLRNIATSTSGLSGDNDIALALAQLRDQRILNVNSTSPREYWDGLIGSLGVAAREALFQSDSLDATTRALEERRRSATGVNLDEEMTNILIAQQAYMGAVRVLEAVSDMMEMMYRI